MDMDDREVVFRYYVVDLLTGELRIPDKLMFTKGYFGFVAGVVQPTKKFEDLLIGYKAEYKDFNWRISSVFLSRGWGNGTYPEVNFKIDGSYKHGRSGVKPFDWSFTIGRGLGYNGGYNSMDITTQLMIALYYKEILEACMKWCKDNDYVKNIKHSKAVSEYLESDHNINTDKDGRAPFTWILYYLKMLDIYKGNIRGSNLFTCKKPILDMKLEDLESLHLFTGNNLALPAPLAKHYFPEVLHIFLSQTPNGDGISEYDYPMNQCNRYSTDTDGHDFSWCYYIEHNLVDILNGDIQLKKDKYDVMIPKFEENFKKVIIESVDKWELSCLALPLNNDDRKQQTNIGIGFVIPNFPMAEISYNRSISDSWKSHDDAIGECYSYVINLCKRFGVYEYLLKGLNRVFPVVVANNILELMLESNVCKFADAMSMKTYPLKDLIGDVLIEKESKEAKDETKA